MQRGAVEQELAAVVGDQYGADRDQAQRRFGFARAAFAEEQHAGVLGHTECRTRTCADNAARVNVDDGHGLLLPRRQREFDDEARARLALAGRAVFRPDAPAKALGNLACDGESQSGIAPESVVKRPFRVESVEDRFEIFGWYARPLILDTDARTAIRLPGLDAH